MDTKELLRHFFSGGRDTDTLTHLSRHVDDATIKECVNQGYLSLRDNNGVWVYDITQKGKNYRDS